VSEEGDLVGFKPRSIYTKYGFIPNPDGGFYDMGFGHLLGPINESVNTLINQLLDAGTLANLQAGFVGKGLRLKMGDSPLRPGEWRAVNAVGDDIRKQMVPIPAKDPSPVLFQLLGSLITAGEKLASVAEIFTGKMPGQNTPATTTMATIEQGMKVFTAIYKRIYKAMEKEFKLLFYLNGEYLNPQTAITVLDDVIGPDDFNPKLYDIAPAADPQASSQTEQMMKAQALLELLPVGTMDPVEVTMRLLQAQQQPDWQKLIPGLAQTGQPQIPPKQDPKMMEMQMKMQAEGAKSQLKQQEGAQKLQMQRLEGQEKLANERAMSQMKLQNQQAQMQTDAQIAQHKQQVFMRDAQNKMAVSDAQHQQKLRQAQEMPKSTNSKQTSQRTTSGTGKATQSPKRSSKR
jgi:chaperonin GroES